MKQTVLFLVSCILFNSCKKEKQTVISEKHILLIADSISLKPIAGADVKLCANFNCETFTTDSEGKVYLEKNNYSCANVIKEGYKEGNVFGTIPQKILLNRETYMKLKIHNVPPSFVNDKIRIVYFVAKDVTKEFVINGAAVDTIKHFPIYSKGGLIKIYLANSVNEYTPEYYNVAEGDTVEKFIDY